MAKYSLEFKLRLVHDHLPGQGGLGFPVRRYRSKDSSQTSKWISTYKELGEGGPPCSQKNENHSVQFKLDAMELYLMTKVSYQGVANLLKMNNPSLIVNWFRTYQKSGMEGLSKQKGRPPTISKKKQRESQPLPSERSQVEKPEKEDRMLKIESAYLKELRRLRLKNKQKVNESHESFTVFEDTFD